MLKSKNTKKQGDIGVGSAIAYFSSIGATVCIPISDSQSYDLIIDDGVIKRVQVKTTRCKTKYGVYKVHLETCGGNQSRINRTAFDPEKVDILFVLTDDGARYRIPSVSIDGIRAINLGSKYNEFLV